MRIVTWNLNVRRDVARQVDALKEMQADVAVLQEVTQRSWAALQPLLEEAGLEHQVSGADAVPGIAGRCVAIASRWPLFAATPAVLPAPELVLCTGVRAPAGPVEVIGVHVPTIARGRLLKVETEEGLAARVASPGMPRVVCGDFNAPKAELADGTVVPFASRRDIRAHAAELAVLGSLEGLRLVDAFRAVHGYEADDRSWWWKNRGKTGGYRLDHILASTGITPRECYYRHDLRETGVSDHAPLFARFEERPLRPREPDAGPSDVR